MKYFFNLIGLILLVTNVLAQEDTCIDLGNQRTELKVKISTPTTLQVENKLNLLKFKSSLTEEGCFTNLFVKGYSKNFNIEEGNPALPAYSKLIEVPRETDIQVAVVDYEEEIIDLDNHGLAKIAPRQPSYPINTDSSDMVFKYNALLYSTDEWIQPDYAAVEYIGTMRGVGMGKIYICPFRYNPVTNELAVLKSMKVDISFENANLSLTENIKSKYYSPQFASSYQSLLNYQEPQAKDDLTQYPIKYVIVADGAFESTLQPFIDWKTKSGYDVVEAYIGEDVSNTTNSIKNYLENIYNSSDPMTYVLFVGDYENLTAYDGVNEDHVTDLYYCEYDGGADYLPDAYYGRISAEDTTELQNALDKIIPYEKYKIPDGSYLNECVMISGLTDWAGPRCFDAETYYGVNEYFNPDHGFTNTYAYYHSLNGPHQVMSSTDPAASNSIVNNISNGVGYACFNGHGGTTGWTVLKNWHIDSFLANNGEYPFMVGICCLTNDFDQSDAFGERLVYADDRGAVGYVGATNASYQSGNFKFINGIPDLDWTDSANSNEHNYSNTGLGAHDGLWHDHGEDFSQWYFTARQIIHRGNLSVTNSNYGDELTRHYWEIYQLNGDPSMLPYMTEPEPLSINYDKPSTGETDITVQTEPYTYVAISQNGNLLDAEWSGSYSYITLDFPSLTSDSASIVAIKQDKIPHINDFTTDPCTNITSLNFSQEYTGTLDTAGVWETYSDCAYTEDGGEQVYQFTTPAAGEYELIAEAITGSPHFYLMTSCDPGGTNLSGCWTSGTITENLDANSTYYIIVDDHYGFQNSEYSIQVNPPPSPCDDVISMNFYQEYTNTLGTFGTWDDYTDCSATSPGEEQVYQFTTTQAGEYEIIGEEINGDPQYPDANFYLMSSCAPSSNNIIGGCHIGNINENLVLEANTTYYIIVDNSSTSENTEYSIRVNPLYPCNNAISMNLFQEYTGTLGTSGVWDNYTDCIWTESGEEQVYQFTVPEINDYELSAQIFSGNPDFYLMTDCNPNGPNFNGHCWGVGSVNVGLVSGVTYYFIVDNSSDSENAEYLISVEPSFPSPCDNVTSMNLSQEYSGTVGTSGVWSYYTDAVGPVPGEEKVYKFTTQEAGEYEIVEQVVSGFPSIVLMSDCAPNSTNVYEGNWLAGTITTYLDANTTYYIIMDNFSDSDPGEYTLQVNPPSSPDPCTNAVSMDFSQNYSGILGVSGVWENYTDCNWTEAGEEQVYRFTTSEAGNYNLIAEEISGNPDFYLMTSCDISSTNVHGDCWDNGSMTENLDAGTTYYIIVDNFSDSEYAEYSLRVNLPSPCDDITTMNLSQEYSGTLGTSGSWETYNNCIYTCAGEETVYQFTTQAAGYYELIAGQTSGDPDFYLMTDCDPYSTNVHGDCWGVGPMTEDLDAYTTYYIVIDNYSIVNTADYTIQVNSITDIEQVSSQEIELYPNPAESTLYIQTDNLNGHTVIMENTLGKLMIETQLSGGSGEIDVSGLTSGIYFVSICTGKGKVVKKVMIQ